MSAQGWAARLPLVRRRAGRRRDFDRPVFLRAFFFVFVFFTFAPLAIVALFSFNSTPSLQNFSGFSLQWYDEFFSSYSLRQSLIASIEIGVVTMIVGTVLGTTLAFALVRARSRVAQSSNVLMLIPLVTPEIVAGVSALVLFTQIGTELSLLTIMIAEITFSISFVTVIVRARLSTLNREVEEAALDLGATRMQTVRLVVLPALWPAIIASALLDLRAQLRRLRDRVLHHGRVPDAAAGPDLLLDSLRGEAHDQCDRDLDARDLVPVRRLGHHPAALAGAS